MCTIRVFSRLSVTPSFARIFAARTKASFASARVRQVTTQSSAHRVSWYPWRLISLSKGVSRILLSSGELLFAIRRDVGYQSVFKYFHQRIDLEC